MQDVSNNYVDVYEGNDADKLKKKVKWKIKLHTYLRFYAAITFQTRKPHIFFEDRHLCRFCTRNNKLLLVSDFLFRTCQKKFS